jgi:cytochrome c-type biogenesis protein
MASGSKSTLLGNLLVFIYLAGFVIPFLLLGLFTAQVLNFLKKNQKVLKYTVKAGGILLIIIGIMTFTGWMNGISGYLNRFTPGQTQENNNNSSDNQGLTLATPTPEAIPSVTQAAPSGSPAGSSVTPSISPDVSDTSGHDNTSASDPGSTGASSENKLQPAYDFTLTDQNGNEHTLSDYKGKVVFLNFWATWCPPCQGEMPDIEELYNEYGKNEGDVIFLGVANPASDAHPENADVTKDKVIKFLDDNNYTFPVVFDETGDILKNYYISAFPTTFMIDQEGNIYGYVPGALTKDLMVNIINQTLEAAK